METFKKIYPFFNKLFVLTATLYLLLSVYLHNKPEIQLAFGFSAEAFTMALSGLFTLVALIMSLINDTNES